MGGGSSMHCGLEEMVSATLVMGRAIQSLAFPGMYRLYDFHSPKAPKLKSARPKFIIFGHTVSDDDEDDEETQAPDPRDYEHLFFVDVGSDRIYIEDPLECNDAGWTPLHSCCMSYLTVPAGIKLIDEYVKYGKSLDDKTKLGPGSFNKSWTALQMCCAYGVEPLVAKLLESGASPNVANCFGYTPLLEACHRGFYSIVMLLVKHHCDLDIIPPEDLSMQSPFVSSPAQSALAESSRCGFHKIVLELINAGASKDLQNVLGWTALHEACFYSRTETVKVLLLGGADATIRTYSGALPYHFAGLQAVRDLLTEMGGTDALPRDDNDRIEMLNVLKELSMNDYKTNASNSDEVDSNPEVTPVKVISKKTPPKKIKSHEDEHGRESSYRTPKESKTNEAGLLHSGPMLGDLPMLNSPAKGVTHGGPLHVSNDFDFDGSPKVAPSKKDQKLLNKTEIPKDIPQEFICQLCMKPMSDPVKTIYGNIVDRDVIINWITKHGHICPLTGAPLSETDLTPMDDLKAKIKKWILQRSSQRSQPPAVQQPQQTVPSSINSQDDDLYNF